ncbi:MAG: VOC family protein [Leptothrix sp. (in: Bacteria)]|nr:VOC family protein [Leptothrix sp. (in: b-proteobacteria)]
MDVYKTHGAFSWSELMTTDPAAAAQFYGKLFGWTVKDMGPQMQHYQVVNVGESGVGGIMGLPEGAPPEAWPQWGCYVTVDDVEATLAKCAELGGATLVPPMDVPGVGRMAVLRDPQGAMLSVIAYSM